MPETIWDGFQVHFAFLKLNITVFRTYLVEYNNRFVHDHDLES